MLTFRPNTVQTNRYRSRPSLPLCAMSNRRENLEPQDEVQQTYHPGVIPSINDPPAHRPYQSSLRLPIPSPDVYFDNYHHPLFPLVYPAIHAFPDPEHAPLAFPAPIGPLTADRYNLLGVTLHDFDYVNGHRQKCFTRYMLWFLEMDDHLMRSICPSDLNDMPCEWDELQGGCPMLRLCKNKHKYPHPHLGVIPECSPSTRQNCKFLHDIEPNCRSIGKQLRLAPDEQFRSYQRCYFTGQGGLCNWGHDLESVRAESVREYWKHRAAARAHGSVGHVKGDIWGERLVWKPQHPVDG